MDKRRQQEAIQRPRKNGQKLFIILSLIFVLPAVVFQVCGEPIAFRSLGIDKESLSSWATDLWWSLKYKDASRFLATITANQVLWLLSLRSISTLVWSIATASLVFTAARLYKNEPVGKWEALHLKPRVWFRVFTVYLCSLLFRAPAELAMNWPLEFGALAILVTVLSMLFDGYILAVTIIATCVSVLDGFAGLRALREGSRLLHQNFKTGFVQGMCLHFIYYQSRLFTGDFGWTFIVLVIAMVPLFSSIVLKTVYYFSCQPEEDSNDEYSLVA